MNKIHLEIDLTTETGKTLLAAINSTVNGGSVPAPVAETPEPEKKKPAKKQSAKLKTGKVTKDVPTTEAPEETADDDLSEVTMDNLKTLARQKGAGANRDKIRAKLKELGEARVSTSDKKNWDALHTFLTELPKA